MTTPVALSRVHFPVTTLGPGARLGLWFQGCSIRCAGCISVDTWDASTPNTTVEDLLTLVEDWAPAIEGVTISGGEPFDQPAALIALLRGLRTRLGADVDFLVFTGHAQERVATHVEEAKGLIDALMTGSFLLEAPQTLALRGSDNQVLHMLTPLGERRLGAYQRVRGPEDDRLDLMADGLGTYWMTGIPRRGDLARLRTLLAAEGTSIRTSEHPATAVRS